MMSPDQQYLIVLGGCDTREVELLNLENIEIEDIRNLLLERINFIFIYWRGFTLCIFWRK